MNQRHQKKQIFRFGEDSMYIFFHGVRGSTAISSKDNVMFGGNTTCTEVLTDKYQFFFDAGTGFTNASFCNETRDIFIIISHFHHDHIQGLAFNRNLSRTPKNIFISSALTSSDELKTVIVNYFSDVYFPAKFDEIFPNIEFVDFQNVIRRLTPEVDIDFIKLNHPGGSSGYSLKTENSKFVVLLDNEFNQSQNTELIKFCQNSSLIIWDGMFTDCEIESKRGWGHSTIEEGKKFIQKLKSGKLVVSHHDPFRSDYELEMLEKKFSDERVIFAKDGDVFCFK